MDGIILIPSQQTEAGARQALSDLQKTRGNPSKALIYTHSCLDYSSGTRGRGSSCQRPRRF
jgi:alkyl sulfatase BDS1-like metallo-beta-lactamase superfamily hydrolase